MTNPQYATQYIAHALNHHQQRDAILPRNILLAKNTVKYFDIATNVLRHNTKQHSQHSRESAMRRSWIHAVATFIQVLLRAFTEFAA